MTDWLELSASATRCRQAAKVLGESVWQRVSVSRQTLVGLRC